MKNRSSYIALAIAMLLLGGGYFTLMAKGLGVDTPLYASPFPTGEEGGKKIILEHADLLTYDAQMQRGVQRLIGNVVFKHDNATMYCDSAYLNDAEQSLEAFGSVHLVQADTVNMYAEYLHYDGVTKFAKLRRNVRLERPSSTLYTDSLNYDRVENVGYYFEGGSVVDPQNTLTSDYGEYFPQSNDAIFRYNVKLVNDSTEITTDNLYYNTASRIARFEGPTVIVSDSGTINSTRGVYDLSNDVGILLDRSQVHSGHRLLVGDSIYYDGATKQGEAFGEVELLDTLQKANLYGDYAYFEGERNYAFATSRARAVDYSQEDTLYVGADTLELISLRLPDSLITTRRDTMSRELRGYRSVRIYRVDAQAVADSMVYSSTDSLLSLYGRPIMWSEQRQSSGDTIKFLLQDGGLRFVDVLGNMFSVEKSADSLEYYNQIMGERMRAHIVDSTLRMMEVFGDVESIFYMQDESTKVYKGINRLKSRDMTVYLDSGELKKIHWQGEAHGKLYPMAMGQTLDVNRLSGFVWAADRRPQSPQDVIAPVDSTLMDGGRLMLSRLKKFSGARAALRAYEAYKKKELVGEDSVSTTMTDEPKTTIDGQSPPSYQYILRSLDNPPVDKQTNYLDRSWVYNPFSSSEDQDSSTISPFIGMLVGRNSTSALHESEPSLSPQEK